MLIGFIGISHLSLNYASASLLRGHKVVFFDSFDKINNYQKNRLNIYEPKLENIFQKYRSKIKFTKDFQEVNESNLNFVALDIITNNKNKVDYKPLNNLLNYFLKYSRKKNPLIIMSQVEVNYTRKIQYPSNLLYHYVETLIFGKAVDRAHKPERIIIGKSNKSQKINKTFVDYLSEYNCPLIQMSFEESELTKGFINTYLASQLITTNNLNELAKLYSCDWEIIKKSLQLDKRIGAYAYLEPGLGISGGNIERDLKTLLDKKKSFKINCQYFENLIDQSAHFKKWIQREIKKLKTPKPVIGLLGLTYKEDSLSVKNAPSLNFLKSNKDDFYIHDFQSKNINIEKKFSDQFRNILFILNKCNIIIILHSHDSYLNLNFKRYKNIKFILDPFRFIKKRSSLGDIKHISL